MKVLQFFLLIVGFTLSFVCTAARVDTLDIYSLSMKKNYRAAVVLPKAYEEKEVAFPVLYLLHGGGGQFSDWHKLTPDSLLLHTMADQFNVIIVTPEGEKLGGYLDSPVLEENRFETYITQEVVARIDSTYRTVRDRKGRVITGLSMGGHGALYLATRHPELFSAAGSMSGALDLNPARWKISSEFAAQIKPGFERILGPLGGQPDYYAAHSVVNMVEKIRQNHIPLYIDCGVEDFLIEPNREFHRRLVYAQVPHVYVEKPGGHSWEYWQDSLPFHLLFFHKHLTAQQVAVL